MDDRSLNSIKQGKRLKEVRELTLLSRRAFAKKYKINISSYQAMEEGRYKKGISLKNASKLTNIFNNENISCSMEWLLHGNGEAPIRQNNPNLKTMISNQQEVIKQYEKYKAIKEKNNLLITAIRNNKINTCRELILSGANLHTLHKKELYLYSQKENTALHMAALYAGSTLINMLIELGINPNIRNRYNETALHFAANEGNVAALNALAEAKANIEASNNEGTTPLMWAAIAGRLNTTELLLKLGAQVNNTDYSGNTATHWAAFNDQGRTVQLLYKHGGYIDTENHEGKTPLDIAISNGQKHAVHAILNISAPRPQASA